MHVGGTGMGVVRLGDGCGFGVLVCVMVRLQVVLPGGGSAFPLDQLWWRSVKSGALVRGPRGVATLASVVAPLDLSL